ncbi:CpaF family protein [Amnibacterium flavum]|uniref:Pilus assembly protein CpaF n=1 Tax=Amnibacterium flavum TaxID=2173173 RepID=A0A2V1HMK5_9MICO|nr:ATPase, T2SS/T4P/T4SS family [Amnibacterium flavum]PVZ93843.1 pilus assembly protein CpaF [Amnibacterium flavum]
MSSPVQTITDLVRQRVLRDGVDLSADAELANQYVRDEVRRYGERALTGSDPLLADDLAAHRQVLAAVNGFGPLQPLLDDPTVEELWINGPSRIFAARGGIPELTSIVLSDDEIRALVERMLAGTGRRVDHSSPFVDASLPDGSRLHVVIPDVTRKHWAVNIRKFGRGIRDLGQLVEAGSLGRDAAEFLRMGVLAGCNILVSGATQAGKTTMLGALLAAARPGERVVTVEETFELDLRSRDVVAMQCRQPSLEGTGEVTLRRLVKEALRMRPDRLVVGEVREAESLDLLIALSSGIPGACSIHAGTAREALVKLCTLPLLAGRNIDGAFVVPTVAASIDIVVHCAMTRGGERRVMEIIAPTGRIDGSVIEASVLFARDSTGLRATGSHPEKLGKFEAAGLDPAHVLGRAA